MRAAAQLRRLRSAGRAIARLGPHPVLITRYVTHHAAERVRRHRLPSTYARRVVGTGLPDGELRPPCVDLPPLEELPPALRQAADQIRAEADAICEHKIDLLGSGLCDLGTEIDWQHDFKSGYRWPAVPYWSLEVTRYDDDSDAKVPWDLSRGHQLLTLARAACIYREERYARELEAQLTSWLDGNPPGLGINWVNAMEVGLRATNWLWAIGTLERWRPLDRALRARVTDSLEVHARHITTNLEGTPFLRSNHYLGDILGLLAIGCSIDGGQAASWRSFGRHQYERQIHRQVLRDGVGFEASLPYHGLTLEMYLLAYHLAASAGLPLSSAYEAHLRRMLDVSAAVRHPDGRIPQFGDADGGRVLPDGFARPPSHDHLLWLGAELLGGPRPLDGDPHPEVAWILGEREWRAAAELPYRRPDTPTAFRAGGLYVLRGERVHMVLRCGDVGQNGNGGHAHNDALSFELSHGEVPFVVDGGTYAYTADVSARNAFRSSAAHNSVVVDGAEVNPIDPERVFQLEQVANPSVLEWTERPDSVRLVAEHDGYRRLAKPVTHRRTVELDRHRGTLCVRDELLGAGVHRAESRLHLAPGTTVSQTDEHGFELVLDREHARVEFWPEAVTVALADGWVSSTYGLRDRAPVFVASITAEAPTAFGYRIDSVGRAAAEESASFVEASS